MIQKVEAELARAQKKKESNLRQQSLDIKVLNRYIGKLLPGKQKNNTRFLSFLSL